ncbi:hypothetical protein BDN70DRAFT_857829 [Pholiota conissans]|uniref:UBX domain-containing protein n=1 Tax=Pholiota conissans TaxID=109636 RepID=A0A9P5Z2T1_9AGAR|nr:hypothetical protein BDN70DRAFT_857829 [Pholiota conissans]
MDALDEEQRHAVRQLQELTNATDVDAATNVLASVDWDVHRAAELIFGHGGPTASTSASTRDVEVEEIEMREYPAAGETARMLPFEVDDSQQGSGPRYRPTQHHQNPLAPTATALAALFTRPLFTLIAVPLHVLSGIVRFIFGFLRVPVPQIRFAGLSFLPRGALGLAGGGGGGGAGAGLGGPERWVRELEEETGAVCVGRAVVPLGVASAVDGAGSSSGSGLTARSAGVGGQGGLRLEEGRKYLPDFLMGTYEEFLRTCQREAKVGCVVLVSAEHDDVAEFKRSTLTDPAFVKILYENEILVWGGDVRDQDAWSASEKLQATTYPFVAFVALQPRRNPATPSSSSASSASSPPTLTVLSRHQGPSIPSSSAPTSATALTTHLSQRLLPRVTPYLGRLAAAQRARAMEREIREEQDRAFEKTKMRDRERIERKMREEREGRMREERERKEKERMEREEREREREEGRRKEVRMGWRRWGRRVFGKGGDGVQGKVLRVAIRLPSGGRIVHGFRGDASVTALYAVVDSMLVPAGMSAEDDPLYPPGDTAKASMSSAVAEAVLEAHVRSELDGADRNADAYWGFKIASAYPRVEIPWKAGARLADVEVLRGGGQVIVEVVNGVGMANGNGSGGDGDEDDGYHTEESE